MLDFNQLMQNLFLLEQLPVVRPCGLHAANTVVLANSHGRILHTQRIDKPLTLPKGACRAVTGPLRFF